MSWERCAAVPRPAASTPALSITNILLVAQTAPGGLGAVVRRCSRAGKRFYPLEDGGNVSIPPAAQPAAHTSCRPGRPSTDFHVLPEADSPGHRLHLGTRRLVRPGGARVARAVNHDVVELHPVRTGVIGRRPGRRLEPLHAHRGAGKILIAGAVDHVVGVGEHAALQGCLHGSVLSRGARLKTAPAGSPVADRTTTSAIASPPAPCSLAPWRWCSRDDRL